MITIKEAIKLTGKGESTIRKMLKDGRLKGEKRKEGRLYRVYVDRREFFNILANTPSMTTSIKDVKSDIVKMLNNEVKRLLEAENDRLRKENEKLNENINKLMEENKRLNEEIKGLLREGRNPRGIIGYLVERIAS